MYEATFQMHRRPFPPSADVSTYVGIGPVEAAGQTLLRVVQRGSGPALVIGAAGTGKSMLCELIAEHFADTMCVALLSNGQLANPKALFQAILYELKLPYRDMDENELRLTLVDFLTNAERCPQPLLLVVDEAHCLPLRILEEIRMLTNLVRDGQTRVNLVLAGGAALEERFTSPKLDSFNQRVVARCYLESLNREETATYIAEQINAAGGDPAQIFTTEASSSVYDATDGIPRLINQVCDHSLIMTAIGGHASVTPEVVQEAWADLQQLPTPWLEPKAGGPPAEIEHAVEFGTLEDDDADVASIPFSREREDRSEVPHFAEEVAADVGPLETVAESRMDEIERQISAVDETYEAAEQEPEPEPVVVANPFDEAFDEEEVIVDNYAALAEVRIASAPLDTAPRVASQQGREIAALLADVKQATQQTQVSEAHVPITPVAEPETEDPAKTLTEAEVSSEVSLLETPEVAAEENGDAVAQLEAAQQRQEELTDAVADLLQSIDEEEEAVEVADIRPIHKAREVAAQGEFEAEEALQPDLAIAPGDDRDLIIVEEPETIETPQHVAKGKARRQQYRQLFNRLRQA